MKTIRTFGLSTIVLFLLAFSGRINAQIHPGTNVLNTTAGSTGNNNAGSGNYSLSMGTDNNTSGSESFAGGRRNVTSGLLSFSFGYQNESQGDFSTTLGFEARALDFNSIAFGKFVTASKQNSIVIGSGLGTNGRFNNDKDNSLMVGFKSNLPTLFIGPSSGLNTLGKVGIGTSDPKDWLQVGDGLTRVVFGSAGGQDLGWGNSYIGFNASRDNGTWTAESDGANNGGALIYGDVAGNLHFSSLSKKAPLTAAQSLSDLDIRNNRSMIIGANGNVGIGTLAINDPFKLSVSGKVRAEEVEVSLSSGWADYVFDSDYELDSIAEVAQFIEKNHHLPNVPSAAEVAENGINLGEMDAILLRKIEELTLYIIEQDKKIEKLLEDTLETKRTKS